MRAGRRSRSRSILRTPLHQNVGCENLEKLFPRAVHLDGAIDASQRGKDLGALRCRRYRSRDFRRGTKGPAYLVIAFDGGDEDASERASVLEEANMSGMQQVEAADRAHYHLAVVLPATPAGN